MERREEITEILLGMMSSGLLRIRAFGWSGSHEQCAHEADHLHNLPGAIREASIRSIAYYYDVERPAFLKAATTPAEFEPYWERFRKLLVEMDPETNRS